MSKKTSDHERKYTSFELEVLAVVEALKKFRIYVLGTSFKIITDCDALVKTLSKKELNPRIARWSLYLQEFNYTIEHRTDSKMAHVDALSRPPHCMLIQNSVHLQFLKAQKADDQITTIKTLLETTPHDNYIVKNKILSKTVNGTDLLVVPDEMQTNIIKIAHERGHFAVLRTQDLVSKDFYIPRLKDKVEKCIQNCVTCILTNRKRGKQNGTLNPIEKNDLPLHTFHLDHLGPLATTSKKYKHVFAVIDAFSKFTWLYPTRSTDAAEVINRLENQRHVFGNPARIITDTGSAFTSSSFEDYCKKQNILHIPLQLVSQDLMAKLKNKIPPSFLCCQNFLSTILRNEQRDALRQDAKKQIYKVQDENRRTYNLRRRQAHKYQLHDLVAIKRTQLGPGLKLKQKYLGPYKVTKVKHNDSYDVEKCDFVDGPSKTSTCAEFMKLWPNQTNST
ncbi:transposon Tf2-6 polyprotein [Trichonephila clavipes]|nr:transposon Tf2-6 polyprotein [Trichonephila clavipes]